MQINGLVILALFFQHLIFLLYSYPGYTFWKTKYNDYKFVTPGISLKKFSLSNSYLTHYASVATLWVIAKSYILHLSSVRLLSLL